MESFCDSPFWDTNITWNSGILEFTNCFQNTILVWFPCVFIWIFSAFDFHYIKTSKYKDIPWNWFNITKIVLVMFLIVLTFLDLVLLNVFKSFNFILIVTPIVKIITFVSIYIA
jgi:ATP-binding cassette subfamily C (CFTR/MRP) protein 1